MGNIQEKETSSRGITLADRVRMLEEEKKLAERDKETEEKVRKFKLPFSWKRKFIQAKKKAKRDMMLVLFLNKKNQIEPPKFMPIFDGNMIVWKNKPYEFDPRAIWTLLGMKGNPQLYLIKEIDRRPIINKFGKIVYANSAVSNMDIDEIEERRNSTESDEFLIKAALKAQTSQMAKKKLSIIAIVVIIIIVGVVAWLLLKGGK